MAADHADGAECCAILPAVYGFLGVHPAGLALLHVPPGATENPSRTETGGGQEEEEIVQDMHYGPTGRLSVVMVRFLPLGHHTRTIVINGC